MNEIPQRAFQAELAARARSLDVGAPPIDAVLAGARRRAGRRRAVAAVVGVVVIAGTASALGIAFAGSSGVRQLPPGQRSSTPALAHTSQAAPNSAPVTVPGPRYVPHVTVQAGLAPGQTAPDNHPVVASGTTDGKPWQASVYTGPDLTGEKGKSCDLLALWMAGQRLILSSDCVAGATDPLATGQSTVMIGNSQAEQVWMFVVPHGTAKVAWEGTDGFRQEMAVLPLPAPFTQGVVVFPNSGAFHPSEGDKFVGYDATGKRLDTYLELRPGELPSTAR
ncbi:hypothetical protein [Catenulispora subtropica]|uniref:Uncharacterized protein n=1 Tax=Catenulispora subtropica TaxID=450798 RepID=A0ABN2R614_9ACTN